MGIFFAARKPAGPAIQAALEQALTADPRNLQAAPPVEAAARAHELAQTTSPEFKPGNFIGALLIAAALLATAISVDKSHPDIAKTLMTSFTSFMGIVLGLLGGEAQKS